MNFNDVLGRPVLRSKKAAMASGDVHQMLAFSHSLLAGVANKATKEGRKDEAELCEEVREDLLALMRKLGKRGKPTVKLNGKPPSAGEKQEGEVSRSEAPGHRRSL